MAFFCQHQLSSPPLISACGNYFAYKPPAKKLPARYVRMSMPENSVQTQPDHRGWNGNGGMGWDGAERTSPTSCHLLPLLDMADDPRIGMPSIFSLSHFTVGTQQQYYVLCGPPYYLWLTRHTGDDDLRNRIKMRPFFLLLLHLSGMRWFCSLRTCRRRTFVYSFVAPSPIYQ